jgi:hypothetical protein
MNPLWKISSIALTLMLMAAIGFSVFQKTKIGLLEAKLETQAAENRTLKAFIGRQNDAVDAMEAKQKMNERARALALQVSNEKSKPNKAALIKTKNATAATCDEAISVLDENVFGAAP